SQMSAIACDVPTPGIAAPTMLPTVPAAVLTSSPPRAPLTNCEAAEPTTATVVGLSAMAAMRAFSTLPDRSGVEQRPPSHIRWTIVRWDLEVDALTPQSIRWTRPPGLLSLAPDACRRV